MLSKQMNRSGCGRWRVSKAGPYGSLVVREKQGNSLRRQALLSHDACEPGKRSTKALGLTGPVNFKWGYRHESCLAPAYLQDLCLEEDDVASTGILKGQVVATLNMWHEVRAQAQSHSLNHSQQRTSAMPI